MNIQEAIKQAMKEDKCISLPTSEGNIFSKIKPQGRYGHLKEVWAEFDKIVVEEWKPHPYQLVSNEWIVVENEIDSLIEKSKNKWWK